MIETTDDVRIEAPVEAVFAYMDDPSNQPEISPSLTRSELLETFDDGGKRVAYTYELGGIGLDGELRTVAYEPERHVRFEMTGALSGEIEWTFEPENGGTRFEYTARYDVPGGVLERLAEPFVRRYNRRELGTTLANLRTRLEHDHDA